MTKHNGTSDSTSPITPKLTSTDSATAGSSSSAPGTAPAGAAANSSAQQGNQTQAAAPGVNFSGAFNSGAAGAVAAQATQVQSAATPVTAAAPATQAAAGLAPEMERTIMRISPWSALKVAALFNFLLLLVWVLGMGIVYLGLDSAGVWMRVNSLLGDLTGEGIGAGSFFTVVVGLGALEAIALTLLAPVAALIYNGVAATVGGLRVTVRDEKKEL